MKEITYNLPYPIRKGLNIMFVNIPRNLTKAEAKRIGAFLLAFAIGKN